MMKVKITKDFGIVKVYGDYPQDESEAYDIIGQFKMTRAGSIWGLDGVAVYSAEQHGSFCLNKSGISKRQARQWVKQGKAELID